MARKKDEPVVPSREELVATMEEVNAVLGLPEPMTVDKKTKDEDIIEMLKEQCEGQLYESDFEEREGEGEECGVTFFSEDAEKTIKAIGIEIIPGEPPAAEETPEEPAEPAPAAKGKKDAPAKAAPAKTAPAKKDAPKPPKNDAPRYTRANAFADACQALKANKAPVALEALAAEANKQYVKNGNGKENMKEAKWYQGTIIPALVALEFAEVTDKGFKLL